MTWQRLAVTGTVIALGGIGVFALTPPGRDLLFHVVPIGWTGEAQRLAAALKLRAGSIVADVGAGDGALIVELARIAGPSGRAFASERTPQQRQRIANRAAGAGVAITVVEGADRATNLPDACCDAITMRMVMHHIADPPAFARDLRRSLKSGRRVAVIDFAPGAIPHLADDHGLGPDAVAAAFTAAGFTIVSRDDRWGGRTFLMVFAAP